jgi:hypothetical protein
MNVTVTSANIGNLQLQGLYIYVLFASNLDPTAVAVALGGTQMSTTNEFHLIAMYSKNVEVMNLVSGLMIMQNFLSYDDMLPPLSGKLTIDTINATNMAPPGDLIGYPECTTVIGSSIYVESLLFLMLKTNTLTNLEISDIYVQPAYDENVATWVGSNSIYNTPKVCTITIPTIPDFVLVKLQSIFSGATINLI